MGMDTNKTPSCDAEAEARAEAKAEHRSRQVEINAALNHDGYRRIYLDRDQCDRGNQQDPEQESEWDTRCPECGRMDHDLLFTISRHVTGCEHAAEMLRINARGDD